VFVWPVSDGQVPTRDGRGNGYNAQSRSQGGLNFLAVSEISAAKLGPFIGEYRERTK